MGAPKAKTVGGGGARPTADAFNKYLLESLNSGAFGGMMSGQNNPSPLSFNTQVDMNNPQFAAMNQMLQQQQTQNLAGMRERFGGPSGRGTPGAFAEASYLSQANPQNVLAMGQLANQIRGANLADLQAQGQYDINRMGLQQNQMDMMMRAMMQAQGIGTPQAQTVMQPSGFSQALGAIGSLAPYALAPFTGGASLGIPGMMGAAAGAGIGAAGKKIGGGGFSGGAGGMSGGMPMGGAMSGMPIMSPMGNPMMGGGMPNPFAGGMPNPFSGSGMYYGQTQFPGLGGR